MQKRLAVLLLRVAGAPDKPSRSYADKFFTGAGRGTRNLVDYFDEVSHGNLDLGNSQVFGWMDYGHTVQDLADEWTKAHDAQKKVLLDAGKPEDVAESDAQGYANLVKRGKIVEWARTAAADAQVTLTGFDGLVCVFNQAVDYFGDVGESVLNWEPKGPPFSIDLTGVAHEVGHNLGLQHSRREGAADEYGDKWDIMSAYGVYFVKGSVGNSATAPYLSFGPGLNAVNMELAGWLDQSRVFTGTGGVLRLRPLHRRDLPGWLAARIQVGYSTLYLELRLKDRWDKKIPAPCILVHKQSTHPTDGNPCSELVIANPDAKGGPRPDLRQGDAYQVGDPLDPFGFYARISVLKIDAVAQDAELEIRVHQRRHVEPGAGMLFGGVEAGGGGLVWTPGRGFTRVPPHSPVLSILEALADYEVLQSVASRGHGAQLEELRLERLTGLRDQLNGMITARQSPKVPAPALKQRREE